MGKQDMYNIPRRTTTVRKFRNQEWDVQPDFLAAEEPLEIQLAFGPSAQRQTFNLAVTMRTPGQDFDLVYGFLYAEGIIHKRRDVLQMRYPGVQLSAEAQENSLLVELHPDAAFDPTHVQRHFYTSSSCGICGKASLEMVQRHSPFVLSAQQPRLSASLLQTLPALLEARQALFQDTGGIHAAALFGMTGELLYLREDVGRHNALDKVIGAALQQQAFPLAEQLLLVSGRAGFELVQKAVLAGIPVMAAVGAPSSLAVDLAEAYGMTLIGFLRPNGFNVYTGESRILA